MSDILNVVINALTTTKSIKDGKEANKSKVIECNDAVGNAFTQIAGSNVNVDEILKAACMKVFGEVNKATVSEYGLIARAGLAGQYTNACKAVDEYATACEAQEVSPGSRQRNLLNLLRDREDHGTACTMQGMYETAARRFAPAKSALRTWMASSEALKELLAGVGFTLTIDTVAIETAVKEAFPDQFASKAKKARKALPQVRVAAAAPMPTGNVVDFVPPPPSAPLPATQPVANVEVPPASSPVFDIQALLSGISQLTNTVQQQGAQLAALTSKRGKK